MGGSSKAEATNMMVTTGPCRAVAMTVSEYEFGDVTLTFSNVSGGEVASFYVEDTSAETGQSILTRLANHLRQPEKDLGVILPDGTLLKGTSLHATLPALLHTEANPQDPPSPCWSTTGKAGDEEGVKVDCDIADAFPWLSI